MRHHPQGFGGYMLQLSPDSEASSLGTSSGIGTSGLLVSELSHVELVLIGGGWIPLYPSLMGVASDI